MTLDGLRRFAVTRSLFSTDSVQDALDRFGFVQADPLRAPARAQDLTLRHRVVGYRAGDLERYYGDLRVEEDFFVNYGFMTPRVHALMHPRAATSWPAARRKQADAVLAFVRERGAVHPREVARHFAQGTVTNYWGGSSSATTHLLNLMHYRGLLRVVRRDAGVRVYGDRELVTPPGERGSPDAQLDGLIDVIVQIYAPLPAQSLSALVRRLQYGTPQWRHRISAALARAKPRLARERVDGVDWHWPADEPANRDPPPDAVRLLTPFDPVVWDRRRFELFWKWAFRFEAYLPVAKRARGYYALPLLWKDDVVGWGNVSVKDDEMQVELGYASGRPPRDRGFRRELDAEIERLRVFLDLGNAETQKRKNARRQKGNKAERQQ